MPIRLCHHLPCLVPLCSRERLQTAAWVFPSALKARWSESPKMLQDTFAILFRTFNTQQLHLGHAATHLTASVPELGQPLGQQVQSWGALQEKGEETAQP